MPSSLWVVESGTIREVAGLAFPEAASVPTPPTGVRTLYVKADGTFASKNSAGAETVIGSGTGSSPSFTTQTKFGVD